MANVLFKRGLQSSLNTMITNKTGVDGTFYLTSDTQRLYVGVAQANNSVEIVPVSDSVYVTSAIATIPGIERGTTPIAGQIYYAQQENVLMIYDPNKADGAGWVQINPDTANSKEEYELTSASGTVTVKNTITDNKGNNVNDSFTVTGSGKVKVSSSGKAITIADGGYNLTTADVTGGVGVSLANADDANDVDSFNIISGSNNVTITKDGDNIKVSVGAVSLSGLTLANGNSKTGDEASNVGFTAVLSQSNNDNITSTVLDPVIAVGETPTASENQVHFVDGVATLNVYNKSEVDSKFATANAMTFKGAIDSTGTLPTSNVAVGDTYIFSSEQTIDGVTYHTGDLAIATGTETNGVITSGLAWQYVPSGNDTVYTYTGTATSTTDQAGIQILEHTNGASTGTAIADIEVKAGTDIAVSGSGTGSTSTVTVAHKAITTEKTTSTETVTAGSTATVIVPTITVDNGHVTAINTKTYSIPDSSSTLDSVKLDVTAANNVATVTSSAQILKANGTDKDDAKSDTFTMTSNTLTLTAENDQLTVDMVWGTF